MQVSDERDVLWEGQDPGHGSLERLHAGAKLVPHMPSRSLPQGCTTSHPVHDCLVNISTKTTEAIECFKIYFYQRGLLCPPPTLSLHVYVGWCHAMGPNDLSCRATVVPLLIKSRKVARANDAWFVLEVTCASNNTWRLLAVTELVFLLF